MRTSGILMPVSSLPSPYGIGSLGAEAYRFVDFLAAAGQRYWQILPIGPTGYGDSPYQSFSAFAANPYFIDLDALEQRGLLTHDEIARFDFGPDAPEGIDYGALFRTRFAVLELAVRRFDAGEDAFRDFCAANAFWLDDYALFMAFAVAQRRTRTQARGAGRSTGASGRAGPLLAGGAIPVFRAVGRSEGLRQRKGRGVHR